MAATWYFLLGAMLVTYVVLDGFDFGAGILHLFVAKTESEKRSVFAAIGPVWDGNEVWLIASGGVLVFAFPRAYAVAFSGLYLPLMMVLWLLVLRGISIEFRSKVEHDLWRAGFDATFALASAIMAIVLGVAMGNIVRGVPVDATGWFQEDLFSDFKTTGARLGAIDWYTALVGLLSLTSLTAHGATYLVWKTEGDLHARSRRAAQILVPAAVVLAAVVTIATAVTQPQHFASFARRPWVWPLPLLALAGAGLSLHGLRGGSDRRAFFGTVLFLAALLLATAATLFPMILRSTVDPALSITAYNAASQPATLILGLFLWVPAVALAIGYFTYVYRSFSGKVKAEDSHY